MERGRGEGGRGDVIQGDLMGGMIGCASPFCASCTGKVLQYRHKSVAQRTGAVLAI